jgi:hypothetical protein
VSASRTVALAAGLALAAALAPDVSLAQVAGRVVGLSLIVGHASPHPGAIPVDPAVLEIQRRLLQQFRFESLRVLDRRHLNLHLQEVTGVDLPTGTRVSLSPLSLTPRGVLISVDIPGTLQTDVRVPNRRQVVIGVDRYEDGKLILGLRPDY